MIGKTSAKEKRNIRHQRLRKKLAGTSSAPRLSVFKSASHIYAQVIDDESGRTLASASTLTPKVKEIIGSEKKKNVETAKIVGALIGEIAVSLGVKKVRFDRGGYPYHGRVKSLADGAREAGLEF
ncbi:MAG: 50S ribosomal protein L18 [Deltaproteobacteria bacterium]